MKEHVHSHCPIRSKERWLDIDWSLEDKVIANNLNVTPQSVAYHRKKKFTKNPPKKKHVKPMEMSAIQSGQPS
jgi:hypothetical protein